MNQIRLVFWLLWAAAILPGMAHIPAVNATEQIPDVIDIAGETHPLFTEPFAPALKHPEQRQNFLRHSTPGQCSANWRGYQAHWSILGAKLYLQRLLRDVCRSNEDMPLDSFFPGQDAPVFADWYSGELLVPLGQPGHNRHMGYSTEYTHYWIFHIQNGRVVSRDTLTHEALLQRRDAARKQRAVMPRENASESL